MLAYKEYFQNLPANTRKTYIAIASSVLAISIGISALSGGNPNDVIQSGLSGNALEANMQQVVFAFEPESFNYLKQETIENQVNTDWKASQKMLQQYLKLSETNNSERYAAAGLQLYEQLSPAVRTHPEIMLSHADLLSFVQDYDTALNVLNNLKKNTLKQKNKFASWKIQPEIISEQVNLRLFTQFIMRGDLPNATSTCRDLRSAKTTSIPLICHAWIKGLTGAPAQGIAMLERLIAVLDEGDILKKWSIEAIIDLYLYSDDSVKAISAYNFLIKMNAFDQSIASQVIDFLILRNKNKVALELLKSLPTADPLIIRRAIVEKELGQESAYELRAQALIKLYEITDDPSHYYDIALWYSVQEGKHQDAWRYVNLHWEQFKSYRDRALRQVIENTRINIASVASNQPST